MDISGTWIGSFNAKNVVAVSVQFYDCVCTSKKDNIIYRGNILFQCVFTMKLMKLFLNQIFRVAFVNKVDG